MLMTVPAGDEFNSRFGLLSLWERSEVRVRSIRHRKPQPKQTRDPEGVGLMFDPPGSPTFFAVRSVDVVHG